MAGTDHGDRPGCTGLVLLGKPGSGKSTQAAEVARRLGVPHVSSGVLLRQEVRARTPLGRQIEDTLAKGELLADDVITGFVADHLTRVQTASGFVLDGFPRSLPQALAAEEWRETGRPCIREVIWLDVARAQLVERLTERGLEGGRTDDTATTIERRLAVDAEVTEPLRDFYRSRAVLTEVDGSGPPAEVTSRILSATTRPPARLD